MRDLDISLNFNFSKFNFSMDDGSQQISILNKNQSVNQSFFQFHSLLNEPPRPTANIYNCIESEQEQGDIREIEYVQNEPQAKHVNSKQYYRMMKRRIKKVINQYNNNDHSVKKENKITQDGKRKYIYESRHKHAERRLRGKDGKFLATRPQSQRFREKKKRGRKPKCQAQPISIL